MTRDDILQAMERKILRSFHQDGLLDLFLGLMLAQFAVTPLMHQHGVGDSWYYAIWLTVYTAAVLGMNWAKRTIVGPRLGLVKLSREQKVKLRRLTWFSVIFSVLIAAFAGGIVAFKKDIHASEWTFSILMALGLLLSFSSLSAVTREVRFLFYGILVSAASLAGEVLYRRAGVPYHGFPLSFGTASLALIGIGVFLFIRFIQKYPHPGGGGDRG